MTRIVSYNILAGGYSLREKGARRSEQLIKIIRSAQPDIVGLVEAIHPKMSQKPTVIDDIAQALEMQQISGGELVHSKDYQIALLTRLPILSTRVHTRPGILARPLLEVCVEERNGEPLTVFVTHLSASFNRGRGGGHIRMREMDEILRIMAPLRAEGRAHLLMGDFNSLAPGDSFKASHLLRYVVQLDENRFDPKLADGHPHLNSVVPRQLRFLKPLLRTIAKSDLLCNFFDMAARFYAPRGCIRDMKTTYIDCFRQCHAQEWGFTCPAGAPAGRIDYIFASANLAERLSDCHVIVEGEGLPGSHASDHLAVTAEFGLRVQSVKLPAEVDNAMTH